MLVTPPLKIVLLKYMDERRNTFPSRDADLPKSIFALRVDSFNKDSIVACK